jgi:hypothetical protein
MIRIAITPAAYAAIAQARGDFRAALFALPSRLLMLLPWYDCEEEHRKLEAQMWEGHERPEGVRPIGPSRSSYLLVFGGLVLLLALPIAGAILDVCFGLKHLAGAGVRLGVVAALGMSLWAAVRERKRLPKGLVGQTDEGIYVYDLNALELARDRHANEAAE